MHSTLRQINFISYIDGLKESGFTEKQAHGLAHLQHKLNHDLLEQVVTKSDLDASEAKLDKKIFELKSELKADINELKINFKWLMGICIGGFMAILANMIYIGMHHL